MLDAIALQSSALRRKTHPRISKVTYVTIMGQGGMYNILCCAMPCIYVLDRLQYEAFQKAAATATSATAATGAAHLVNHKQQQQQQQSSPPKQHYQHHHRHEPSGGGAVVVPG